MAISDEVQALQTNLTNSYTAVSNKGGTLPQDQCFDNLPNAIGSISTGGTINSLNVTPTTSAQTITASGGVDGYSPVNVSAVDASIDSNIQPENIKKDVVILGTTGTYEGSGGVGITREVSAQGVYQIPTSSFEFKLPDDATDVGNTAMYYAFVNCTGLTSLDLSSLTTISGNSAMSNAFNGCTGLTNADLSNLTTISGSNAMQYAFVNCTGLTSLDLSSLTTVSGQNAMQQAFYSCTNLTNVDLSSLTTVSGQNAMQNAFGSCTGLTNISFNNLQTIGIDSSAQNYGQFAQCFSGCTNLTSITFPKLEKIYCTGSASTSYGTFNYNDRVQKMYFPKLDTITYGTGASTSNQGACKYIFSSCSALTELHFGASNQSAIEASPGYSTAWGRGAGNVTIYFDL